MGRSAAREGRENPTNGAEALLSRYLEEAGARRNLSPYTLRNYASDLRHFFAHLDGQGIEVRAADRHAVRGYLAALLEEGVASGSISRRVSTIRSFYRYLRAAGVIDSEPLAGVRGPRRERRLPSFLVSEEVTALVTSADADTPQGLRDRAILELLYASGLRVSEVTTLNTADVDLGERALRVHGKGNRERVVLMGRPAARALDAYLRKGRSRLARGSQEALFLNRDGGRISQRRVQLVVRKYALAAGLDRRAYPHLLRHTFATHMLDGGAELRVVQELLGHASPNTTQIYMHVTEERQRRVLEDALDGIARVEEERRRERQRAGDEQEE